MMELAPLCPDDRLHMLRPAPAWLEHLAADRDGADRDEIDGAVIKGDGLVRCVEGLRLEVWWTPGSIVNGSWLASRRTANPIPFSARPQHRPTVRRMDKAGLRRLALA
jgi:hypothetical protein